MSAGYYGQPMIKPPEWTDLIPLYFFTGGLAGAAATVAFAERMAKNDVLARPMICVAAGGAAISGFCLIADLKRPARFTNMLRVFKPTSPMSVGVYVFGGFSAATFAAAAGELTGILRPAGIACEAIAALLGPMMSCYTAVLISDTAVPAWHYGRKSLPALFAATSAATAGAAGMIAAPPMHAGTARRLAIAGAAAALLALERLHAELGPRQAQAYQRGEAAMFSKIARACTIAGGITALFGKRSAPAARIAGALLLAGGLAERFGVFRAGCNSAKDPSFTIDAQRAPARR